MGSVIGATRYIFVVATISLVGLAVVLVAFGSIEVIAAVVESISDPVEDDTIKEITLDTIEILDVFLLGIAVYVLGIGLYTLFVSDVDLPKSLKVSSLSGMKSLLASTMVVVLGVAYLGVVFKGGEGIEIGLIGVGVAAVIAALTFYIRSSDGH